MGKLKSLLKRVRAVAVLVIGIGFSSLSVAAESVLDRVVDQGVLRVAMSGEQQPFNFVYGKNKSVVGFDVDLAEELADLMKVRLELIQMPFDELLGSLEQGKSDMVISGMTITAERTRRASFVGPYMLSGKSMLVSEKVFGQAKQATGFNSADVKFAALRGSTSENLVKRELPEAALIPVANYYEGIAQLLDGKVDGMVADMPILAMTRQQHQGAGLQLVTPPLSIEPLGIAIAGGDEQFENLLRNYLAVFEKTGLLLNLHRKWFEIGHGNLYRP